jgi:hypothetical protein
VLIAAVGVWGVFKMAFWVAGQTGRSLSPEAGVAAPPPTASAAASSPEVKAASPLEGLCAPAAWAARPWSSWAAGGGGGGVALHPGGGGPRLARRPV